MYGGGFPWGGGMPGHGRFPPYGGPHGGPPHHGHHGHMGGGAPVPPGPPRKQGIDFYAILGVARTATDEELKKAFRREAMKWHPDKNKGVDEKAAEERFKDVARAYDALSDPDKRRVYDRHGEQGLETHFAPRAQASRESSPSAAGRAGPSGTDSAFGSSGGGDGNANGGGNHNGGGGGSNGQPAASAAAPEQPPPVLINLFCTLEELYNGCRKKMKITKKVLDESTGQTRPTEKYLTINVKKGWKHGTRITFEKEGDQGVGITPSDVVFVIHESEHPYFTREGSDLRYHQNVPLLEALTGFTVEVRMLDDRVLSIPITDVISPDSTKTVAGEGMPRAKDPTQRGNLVIYFKVIFPESITDDQKTLITAALG